MDEALPTIYLARHGETAWSAAGLHTGRTDLPLTERGKANARLLGARLAAISLARVYSSPLRRALDTCRLAGRASRVEVDADLVEWDYGDFEGQTSAEIRQSLPDWELFRDGCPGGESVADVARRADRVAQRLAALDANAIVFSSGHFLRMLAARWLELEPAAGSRFFLSTASLSGMGYEHARKRRVIRFWNDTAHLKPGLAVR